MNDSAGKTRIRLRGENGTIKAYNKAGKTRLSLHGNSGSIFLKNKVGRTRVRLGLGGTDDGSVIVYDRAGNKRVRLGKVFNLGEVAVFSKAGRSGLFSMGGPGWYRSIQRWKRPDYYLWEWLCLFTRLSRKARGFVSLGQPERSPSVLQTSQRFLIPNYWETTSIPAGREESRSAVHAWQ